MTTSGLLERRQAVVQYDTGISSRIPHTPCSRSRMVFKVARENKTPKPECQEDRVSSELLFFPSLNFYERLS